MPRSVGSISHCLLLTSLLTSSLLLLATTRIATTAASTTTVTTPTTTAATAQAETAPTSLQDAHRSGLGEGLGGQQQQPDIAEDAAEHTFDFDVLVTGYEPFLDHATNPAHEVAVSLNGTCDVVPLTSPSRTVRVCYDGVAVAVSPEGSSWTARALQEAPRRWDGIIHLGFESSAKGLKLETVAANVKSSEEYGYMWNADIPCQKEGTPFEYIHQGSPCVLPTTAPLSILDLQGLAALLESSGRGDLVSLETWSRDAGAYYCNDQFYRTLRAIREYGTSSSAVDDDDDGYRLLTPALFIHLPDVAVLGQDKMAVMVRFVAQNIMRGTVGLLPESCR
eukprot:jgi/Undpi1/6250/HiC_scaffold_20.g08734.m1